MQRLAVLMLSPLLLTACNMARPAVPSASARPVFATVETQPVASSNDAADDPAIWIHPTDPAKSLVIGTDKKRGLDVYDLSGKRVQSLPDGRMNNVDLRYGFLLDGAEVAIVAATNRNLPQAVKDGLFREDLYHRFNEFSIEVPPLRHRQDDIMMFADFFLEKTNAELNKNVKGFSEEVVKIFHHYNWPGNLRELNNVIKRSTLLTSGEYVEVASLPFEITHFERLNFEPAEPVVAEAPSVLSGGASADPAKKHIPLNDYGMKHASIDAEFELIVEALKKCNYNKSKAAQLLNIDRKTLYNKMREHGISEP